VQGKNRHQSSMYFENKYLYAKHTKNLLTSDEALVSGYTCMGVVREGVYTLGLGEVPDLHRRIATRRRQLRASDNAQHLVWI